MNIDNKFLPIGTVVLLKDGQKELMIISYCVSGEGDAYDKNGKVDIANKMFDYAACSYPEGLVRNDQLYVFNHENIEKVCFKGYETENSKKLSELFNGVLAEMNEESEKVEEDDNSGETPEEL